MLILNCGGFPVFGTLVLISLGFVIDKIIIPGSKLDDEIRRDQNWGAAIVVGSLKFGMTLLLNTFLPETCQNQT